ncbi:beta-xylanase [Microbispora rosea subsp. aerata]|nr:endo-1,4-beta-xylanase [Microbispora rosea]GGO27045.1 beta-xylanase [Microbispora rosea subsp. aerata]GIH58525.1 beta-xylanase [Microbispora rosea subsp. aerata]GLJ86142.1 beta-xylanase [Microbispora rosea subsp. aerata]
MRSLRSRAAAAVLCLFTGLPVVAVIASPADAATVQVAKYDFEDGTTQGWGPRGDGVEVSATSDAAHSGSGSLLTTGRTATWHGASVSPPFEKGVTYQVTAYARMVSGEPSSTIALTMQRTPDGGETTYERVAAATVTDDGWAELSGTYSFSADSTGLELYAESSDATAAYYIDDIVITSDTDPTRSGLSTDFETGTAQGWSPRASASLAVTADVAHGGSRSLAVTNRADFWDGPAISVLGKMAKGSKYTLSAWVRLGPGTPSGNLGLSVERRTNGTPSYERVAAPKAIPAGQWVELTGTYTLAHDVDFLSVYVESDTGTFPFYLDDFTLTYVEPKPIQTGIPSLRDKVPFTIGAAISRAQTLGQHSELLLKHFGGVTPGNALKWDATEPSEGEFTLAEGDHLVNYAVEHGLTIRGHTLAWHSQTPDWVFKDGDRDLTSSPGDKALLLKRLENHVKTLVGRYKGKIAVWDVVNEVVDENQPDGLRRSKWFQITGLDFIRTAFRVARETDPDAKLFINDYNTEFPRKRQALYDLVKKLKAEGVPIDGVGHQLHLNIEQPPASEVEATVEKFATLGVDQQITELDVSVYPDFVSTYDQVPAEVLAEQGYRYKELFDVFRRHKSRISSVTVWGLADDDTWLSTFPITRLNAPLLFDDELQAKPAYWGVVDPAKLPPLVRKLEAPAAKPKVDGKRDPEWDLLPDVSIARVGDVSAGFQARSSDKCLYVLAEVRDPRANRGDRVTFTLGGTPYAIERDGAHPRGVDAAVHKTEGGYRVEARLPLGSSADGTALTVTVKDASDGSTTTWTGEVTPVAAVKLTTAPRRQPVVDGVVDGIWASAPEIRTATWIQGTSGATARARAVWSGGTLYLLARVTDPTLSEESANPWEQDSVEFFVDPGNGKTKGYGDDDGQYRISFSGKTSVGGPLDPAAIAGNLTAAAKVVPGGYVVEAAVKLPTITLRDGVLLGFDVQVNDATGAARTGAVTWSDATGQGYRDTSHWGVLKLTH